MPVGYAKVVLLESCYGSMMLNIPARDKYHLLTYAVRFYSEVASDQ
jgi:hypothetical protein